MTTYIRAPEGVKYLKDILKDGSLPKNCLFDKVLTGCGGSYVALTSPEPYIIAVPTKALVADKVTSPHYKEYKIQGVSEDFPLGNRRLHLFDKIIVTYKSLPKVAEKVDISKYNLLVDELHMLTTMNGYAKDQLVWMMQNFNRFKSYCFMSATVPRSEHLLPELRDIPKVKMIWDDVSRVDFECLVAKNISKSLLKILLDHRTGVREGTPYVFYNSVSGICNIVKKWSGNTKYKPTFNIVCANTDANKARLKEVKLEVGKPNRKADFHFITATAFEGVDFYDPEGVTYVVSDRRYSSTKYSIETTIPQIIGRLRDSKFNNKVTVIFNEHDPATDLTPREFSEHLDSLEAQAKSSVRVYQRTLEEYLQDKSLVSTLRGQLKELLDNPYVFVEGRSTEFEELLTPKIFEENLDIFPQASFYPYARILSQQTYDLFQEERYVRGTDSLGNARSLSEVSGVAPVLTDAEARMFKVPRVGIPEVIALYQEDKEACRDQYPEWYPIIDTLGVAVSTTYQKDKRILKRLYKAALVDASESVSNEVAHAFKPGDVYTASYIKEYLQSLGFEKPTVTTLNKWYFTQRTMRNGVSCYRIIQRVDDILD